MKRKKLSEVLICLGLVVAVFLASTIYTPYVYASVDDEDFYEEDGQDTLADDDDDVDELPAANGVDDKLNELNAQKDKLQSDLKNLENQAQEIKNSINAVKGEKEKAQKRQDSLAYQITVTADKIANMENQIALLAEEITLRQEDIASKQAEIDYNYELLKKRLRAMYMQDDGTILGLLLGADSFADFLSRTEYVVRVAEHDRNLMQKLTDKRIAIEEDKAALEKRKKEQEAEKERIEGEKKDLSVLHHEAALQVQDIARMENEYMADLAKNKAQQDAAQSQLNDVFRQIEWSKNPYAGGVMEWPLPGHYTLSSHYGPRFNGNDFHTGMDITSNGSGCFGAIIVAANDGVVKKVNTTYTKGVGYGIYVIIDHGLDSNGDSISTLYGHCSEILVSNEQTVTKGQAIAKVGSTGWSTGPHLHFEVRKNGNHVEPSQYLKG